ncbi:MAG: secretin N-terminal domain-containing protein [Janthinobacterium lividum]|uniref:secretin N-terminal domain-containing protein n=1 Tax=Pseudomonas sp. MWU16-30317 TaxID=2878095 RepID=UPI001CFACB1B|nr:secretin N-terminal domain-containing protein [Pseudomonas sp. MWU16-30317]
MSLRPLLSCLLLTLSASAVADTQVLQLNNRTSDELLPVARDFLGQDGKVSAYGNQLIVNAPPDKIDALRSLLGQLDVAAKRLLISVDTSDSNNAGGTGYSVNGQGQGRVINYGTANRTGGVQQVQASEGVPALIQTGESVPLTTTQPDAYGRPQAQTQYRNVTQGFYVTASVTGDIVHLSISTNNDRMSERSPDVVKIQSTDTQVSGRLGEWITLGGINEQSQLNRQGYTRNYATQGRNDMTLRVKVDSLD